MMNDKNDTHESYRQRALNHLWVQTQQYNDLATENGLIFIEKGHGIYLENMEGKKYIDAMSGLWVVAVGHGRNELGKIAEKQISELAFANPFAYATPPAVDLASKLAELTPSNINKFFFVNSGSEAVETAIRMAKQYHYNNGDSKRYKVISRIGSYHGTTMGALSVNGSPMLNRAPFEPLLPGIVHVPNTNGFGEIKNEKTGLDDMFWARYTEERIKFERPETIAAFIAEPISTSNGSHVPSKEYWEHIRKITQEHGILLIHDEVINGFGRTGKWFASEHFGVEPDLLTMAKQLSSGYAPIAAVGVSDQVAEGFVGEKEDSFVGGTTWGANPVSCAIALGNLEILESERLPQNSATTGEYLKTQLEKLKNDHPIVSDTRGIGLMHSIDLLRNPETGEDFKPEDNIAKRMPQLLLDAGILSRAGNSIQVAPPLVINREEIDELVDGIDQAIGIFEDEIGVS
ncbi:MAG: aspartate aminotransferase family protein [Chloroflexi bacterium]|nr:aspartate aminotransferase family protein [Chloroflexota bacterium]|tara:strand:+ start:1396 stop:2775 length:1380 start_codon:yes stop_codon:yes gene_type:complete